MSAISYHKYQNRDMICALFLLLFLHDMGILGRIVGVHSNP